MKMGALGKGSFCHDVEKDVSEYKEEDARLREYPNIH